MLLSTKLWFLFSIASLIALISLYSKYNSNTEEIKHEEQEIYNRGIQYSDLLTCRQPDRAWTESMPLRYLGPSLTSSNGKFLTLCPGDYFGDLNGTYLVVKNCDLEMYHKGQWIWAAKKPRYLKFEKSQPKKDCAFFVGPDGNLILKHGGKRLPGATPDERRMFNLWKSDTDFAPLKTELRVQDKQFQILQTFQDGTQRLFYVAEASPRFQEYLTRDKRVGGSKFVKDHNENNTIILRKNEYLGDIGGLHLLLQANCELHLINQTGTIWYFKQPISWTNPIDCSLIVQEGKWISLSNIYPNEKPTLLSLMILHSFKVLQSELFLKNDQLTIIQTLEYGSKLTFKSQTSSVIPPIQETGLKMHKEPRQIAQNNLVVPKSETPFIIERMDYIGDLDGLHLMLRDDCTLMLENGQDMVWEMCSRFESPCMECFIEPFTKGSSSFECQHTHGSSSHTHSGFLFPVTSGEIALEKNYAKLTRYEETENKTSIYYAGPNTHRTWFHRISEHSLVLKAHDKDSALKEVSHRYIGDLNGIYFFMFACHWTLFNQTQILWETGENWTPEFDRNAYHFNCQMSLKGDGNIVTPYRQTFGFVHKDFTLFQSIHESDLWSTKNTNTLAGLDTSELAIHDNWLWLTNTFTNGTVQKFKALEGTHDFIAV